MSHFTGQTIRSLLTVAICLLLVACQGNVRDEMKLGVTTYKALRHKNSVRQRLDYTCGAASLATILTYYWGRRTSEAEILNILRLRYPTAQAWTEKVRDGVSFADLIFAANVLGYEAQAVEVNVEQIALLEGPIILHLDKAVIQHFSVLKMYRDGVAYFADPIVGNIGMADYELRRQYTGKALAVWKADADLPQRTILRVIRDGQSARRIVGGRPEARPPSIFVR